MSSDEPTPILNWLADNLPKKPSALSVRKRGRPTNTLVKLTSKHFRMVADYLDNVPVKQVTPTTDTTIVYRTLKKFGLSAGRKKDGQTQS